MESEISNLFVVNFHIEPGDRKRVVENLRGLALLKQAKIPDHYLGEDGVEVRSNIDRKVIQLIFDDAGYGVSLTLSAVMQQAENRKFTEFFHNKNEQSFKLSASELLESLSIEASSYKGFLTISVYLNEEKLIRLWEKSLQ